MALPKTIPALADLTQDIAGRVPIRLLQDWANGEQDPAAAESLLESFRTRGTVVSSDTSGLSRMTQAMDLLDVLSLVSRPKEMIHALGSEIGGRAIGKWVADNTQMIYPETVDPQTVVDAMSEVQFRIHERLEARIGMCVHTGMFYEIGGGLYGGDADEVESLAENWAGPGEILLTDGIVPRLNSISAGSLTRKIFGEERAWLLPVGRRMAELAEKDTGYPHPFPEEFYRYLMRLQEPQTRTELKELIHSRWLREKAVVFIVRRRGTEEAASAGGLLDDLVINALMETVILSVAPARENIAGSAGGLAILTFDTPPEALDFTRVAMARLAGNGLQVRAAIDAGPVLLFRNENGPGGIAGDPVNIASKLSEDAGRDGFISITDRVARQLGPVQGSERFEMTVSGPTQCDDAALT